LKISSKSVHNIFRYILHTGAQTATRTTSLAAVITGTTDLCIVVLGPLNAIKKVTEIGFHWNVVLVRLELLVEVFIVLRVLLEDD